MSFLPIHRVVTGHDASGKSIAVLDGVLPTIHELAAAPGMIFHEVWETPASPAPVDNGPDATLGPLMHNAPPQGTRIRFVDMPPDSDYLCDSSSTGIQLFQELNSSNEFTATSNSPHPMMHRTEAVDYGIVIEGEISLVLDDSEVPLRPGSVVVQRGTNHAWANRSGKTCRMLFIQIDGKYDHSILSALGLRAA